MDEKLTFEELVDRFSDPLYRFAMSLSRIEMDAEDLVQQTFLAWAEKGHQLQDASKVKSWLFTTLHRAYLGSRRRVVRFPHVEIESVDEELPFADPESNDRLDCDALLNLMDQVDEQNQAPMALFYLEQNSYPEIATILEIPIGTVKSRIARGVTQLKQAAARHAKLRTVRLKGPSQ